MDKCHLVEEFVRSHDNFEIVEPEFPFNEGVVNERITYWPGLSSRESHKLMDIIITGVRTGDKEVPEEIWRGIES